jgi:hypothetical protein
MLLMMSEMNVQDGRIWVEFIDDGVRCRRPLVRGESPGFLEACFCLRGRSEIHRLHSRPWSTIVGSVSEATLDVPRDERGVDWPTGCCGISSRSPEEEAVPLVNPG